MKFRTAYDSNQSVPCSSGSRWREKFVREGTSTKLVSAGKEDIYDSIQKAGMGLSVEDLIRRSERGDTTAIGNPDELPYVDMTNTPKDLLEAHAMLIAARSKYDSLPSELKGKFDNDFGKFLSAAGSGEAFEEFYKINSQNNQPTVNKEEGNA